MASTLEIEMNYPFMNSANRKPQDLIWDIVVNESEFASFTSQNCAGTLEMFTIDSKVKTSIAIFPFNRNRECERTLQQQNSWKWRRSSTVNDNRAILMWLPRLVRITSIIAMATEIPFRLLDCDVELEAIIKIHKSTNHRCAICVYNFAVLSPIPPIIGIDTMRCICICISAIQMLRSLGSESLNTFFGFCWPPVGRRHRYSLNVMQIKWTNGNIIYY